MKKTVILKNFDILEGGDFKLRKNVNLVIKDGAIDSIGGRQLLEDNEGQVIDGGGRLLVPGFVNAHTHLSMTIFRGYADDYNLQDWLRKWILPAEEELTPEDIYWAGLLAMIELVQAGVTYFSDMYFYMDQLARAAEKSGLRALLAYGVAGKNEKEAKEGIEGGRSLAENWHNKGRIKVALGPHAPYSCADSVWREIAKEAQKRGLMIHTHIAETKADVEQSKRDFGKTPFERLRDLGVFENPTVAAHCVYPEEADFNIFKKDNVGVVYNPTSNAKLASGIAPVADYLERGIEVGLGTDGAASNNDLSMLEEIEWGSYLQKLKKEDPTALPAKEALHIATRGGAKVLREEKLGLIKEGWKADLVAFERTAAYWVPEYNVLSNLVYSAKSTDVSLVMVAGEVLLKDGAVTFVDEEEVYSEIAERAKKFKSQLE